MTDKRDKFEDREETKPAATIGINWDEQPTDKHCWLEAIGDVHSEESGWYILNGSIWKHIEHTGWNVAGEGEAFTVHRKPIEPYKPAVGEWCEWRTNSMNWCEAFYIGVNDSGHKVFNNRDDKMFFVPNGVGLFRPIKTEREQFIEKSVELAGGAEESVRYGIQYDNGARFKGPGDE